MRDFGTISDQEIARMRKLYPRAFSMPLGRKALLTVGWLSFTALFIYSLVTFGFTPEKLYHGLGKLGYVAGFMFPPHLYETWQGWREPVYAIIETLAMAFLGTLLASLVATPLGFIGAKNINRFSGLHFCVRRGFDFLRALEQLILALVFIRAFGLGPLAGIFAIAVSDTGTLSKLFAEAIENVDPKPIEGVKSNGAGWLQTTRLAVLPQVLPVMISNSLYFFESNTRTATILGIVGAGGIGFLLDERIRANNWDEVMTIIFLILITVAIIDKLSWFLRMKVIGKESN